MKELLFYASVIGDHEKVIDYYIQHGDFQKALVILSKLTREEYYYKFSSILMHHIPQETVNAWIRLPKLEPRKLIPAIMHYNSAKTDKDVRKNN